MSSFELKEKEQKEIVFEKVDTLFSLIHTLPNTVQAEALTEIKQRLMHNIIKLPENLISLEPEKSSIFTPYSFSEESDDYETRNGTLPVQSQNNSTSLLKLPSNSSQMLLKQCEVKLKRVDQKNTQFEKPVDTQKKTKQEQTCQYSEDCRQREHGKETMIHSKHSGCNTFSVKRKVKKLKPRDDVICSICNQLSHSQSSFKIHKHNHPKCVVHKCDICGKQFSRKSLLGYHKRNHHAVKSFNCPTCDYSAVTKTDVERHIPRHTKQRNYKCNICDKSYFTNGKLKDHINNVHNRTIREVCEICGFATHSKDIMRRHRIVRHTNQETFQCPVCNSIIKQKGTFLIHMRIHTGERPYSCKECSKTFKSRSQLASHMRIHREGEFICETCGRKFRSRSHLQRHIVVHTGAKPFSCHLCLYACNVRANITKHVRSVHGLSNFTLKEAQPKAIPKDMEISSASVRGFNAAKECLKKLSAELGSEMTVQELQQKEIKSKNVLEMTENLNTAQKTSVVKTGKTRDTLPTPHESSCLTTTYTSTPSCDMLSNNKENATNNSHDILLDAMKLLTSVSTDEEETTLADASFLNRNDHTFEIDNHAADSFYMYIIQVYSDKTDSFQFIPTI